MARQRGGRGGKGGGGDGGGRRGGANPSRKRGSRRRGTRAGKAEAGKGRGKPQAASYYMQPGRRGTVVILHRAVGNRVSPKVCGVMPSREHGKALVEQLRRAESALHDLFYEATDDGIEALEAVLAACREEVLTHMPPAEGTITVEEMDAERERIQSEHDLRAMQQRAI